MTGTVGWLDGTSLCCTKRCSSVCGSTSKVDDVRTDRDARHSTYSLTIPSSTTHTHTHESEVFGCRSIFSCRFHRLCPFVRLRNLNIFCVIFLVVRIVVSYRLLRFDYVVIQFTKTAKDYAHKRGLTDVLDVFRRNGY